jgi:hypothetical protein
MERSGPRADDNASPRPLFQVAAPGNHMAAAQLRSLLSIIPHTPQASMARIKVPAGMEDTLTHLSDVVDTLLERTPGHLYYAAPATPREAAAGASVAAALRAALPADWTVLHPAPPVHMGPGCVLRPTVAAWPAPSGAPEPADPRPVLWVQVFTAAAGCGGDDCRAHHVGRARHDLLPACADRCHVVLLELPASAQAAAGGVVHVAVWPTPATSDTAADAAAEDPTAPPGQWRALQPGDVVRLLDTPAVDIALANVLHDALLLE